MHVQFIEVSEVFIKSNQIKWDGREMMMLMMIMIAME